jgi:hypothetical protein
LEINKSIKEVGEVEFSGTGIAVLGGPSRDDFRKMEKDNNYIAEVAVSIDGKPAGVRKLPFNFHSRALEVFFELELTKGKHTFELEWLNPVEGVNLPITRCLVFSDKLVKVDY